MVMGKFVRTNQEKTKKKKTNSNLTTDSERYEPVPHP
jgi:hypothetical protein